MAVGRTEAQVYYRIKADFVLKAKAPTGQQQLTIGKVYFDKNIRQIVYDITFPEKEIWIQRDTVLYKIVDSKVTGKQNLPSMIDFSIYNLVLNGNLADYGLRKTNFKIKNVRKEPNNVISTWEPPKELKKMFGDILISNVNQQLDGIVFKNTTGEVMSRQFFRNYQRVKGLSFPMEIIKEVQANGLKGYELTNFSNIQVNDISGENKYDYKIPVN
jgi:hypothetical protein